MSKTWTKGSICLLTNNARRSSPLLGSGTDLQLGTVISRAWYQVASMPSLLSHFKYGRQVRHTASMCLPHFSKIYYLWMLPSSQPHLIKRSLCSDRAPSRSKQCMICVEVVLALDQLFSCHKVTMPKYCILDPIVPIPPIYIRGVGIKPRLLLSGCHALRYPPGRDCLH